MTLKAEAMNGPYSSTKDGDQILVRGTYDLQEARETAEAHGFKVGDPIKWGRFRKVPSQWGSWRLHEDKSGKQGSFAAVVFERKGVWS